MGQMADRLMWYLGPTIIIVEGLVGKTLDITTLRHYACYKTSHICLDLI